MYKDNQIDLGEHIPRIALLEEKLIDQIKAGEVLESPANMAKELIENSLDAKATKITLKILDNPMQFFSIHDNGHGIHPEDLPLVFARHATSKIHSYQDLCELGSFGFRGEALASLGAIAKVVIKTSLGGKNPTYMLEHDCGRNASTHSLPNTIQNSGTEIVVTDLFKSTPARFKFIQKKLAELQKFKKIINSYIIAYPAVSWDIHFDHEFSRLLPDTEEARVKKMVSSNLIKKELSYKNITMRLWIDLSPDKKKNNLNQYIFVNNRPIQLSVAHAIITKFLGFSPSYVLFIEIDQNNIDVNVHPAKTEVKFFDKASVLSVLTTILKGINHSHTLKTHNHSNSHPNQYLENEKTYTVTPQDNYLLNTPNESIKVIVEQSTAKYLVDLNALFIFIVDLSLQQKQKETMPLLISYSLNFEESYLDKTFINEWKEIGLLIKFNKKENVWGVESVPYYWPLINYQYMIEIIFEKKLYPKLKNFKQLIVPNIITNAHLPALIKEFKENELIDKKIIFSFTELLKHE